MKNRLILTPRVKIYRIYGGIFNEVEAKYILKSLNIEEPLETFLLRVVRRVCGKTWTEIL